MRHVGGDLPLYVVSEFPPPTGQWIPYHPLRSAADNAQRLRRQLTGLDVAFTGIYLDPDVPYWPLRRLAFTGTSWRTWMLFTPDLNHFMLRPRSLPTVARFAVWRAREILRFQLNPGGDVYTWLWRLAHPSHLRRPWAAWRAQRAVGRIAAAKRPSPAPVLGAALPEGITVVIPSRNGAALLNRLLPLIAAQAPAQVVVVDNGSDEDWAPPAGVEVLRSNEPLSFAAAVNRGIAAARFSHVCLLNNDMVIEPGFFTALRHAFDQVPGLFCATAQIFFPEGQRRQETGKAAMPLVTGPQDFPLTCLEPLPGEDLTWVLYGSGGCSLYDTARLRALGGFDEAYVPAYVEDLDLGYRAWLAGWPSVYAGHARVVHHHRSTTSRYFDETKLRTMVELNYLRFLARAIHHPPTFERLWRRAITRLNLLASGHEPDPVPIAVLAQAPTLPARAPHAALADDTILALGSGDIASFPGQQTADGLRVLIATCYPPYPLAHGGAVRMYNLMRRAAAQGICQVLVIFGDELTAPAPELLAICHRVVMVRRRGSHYRLDSGRPDVVDEFDSPVFRAVLERLMTEFRPQLAQLEFTQMAVYLDTVARARTLLIEHDITIDLYQQLLDRQPSEDLRDQLARWTRFEQAAWKKQTPSSSCPKKTVSPPTPKPKTEPSSWPTASTSSATNRRPSRLSPPASSSSAASTICRICWPSIGSCAGSAAPHHARHPPHHRRLQARLLPRLLPRASRRAARSRRRGGGRLCRGRPPGLSQRHRGDRPSIGLRRHQHQDPRSDGHGQSDRQHLGRREWPQRPRPPAQTSAWRTIRRGSPPRSMRCWPMRPRAPRSKRTLATRWSSAIAGTIAALQKELYEKLGVCTGSQ